MLRKICKRQRNSTNKCCHKHQECANKAKKHIHQQTLQLKKQNHLDQLIQEIDYFKQRVVNLSTNNHINQTPHKKHKSNSHVLQPTLHFYNSTNRKQNQELSSYKYQTNRNTNQQNYHQISENRPTCHYPSRFKSAMAEIHLHIQNNNNDDIEALTNKIKQLQQKNKQLNNQAIILEGKVLFEEQQKHELKKMIFEQDGQYFQPQKRRTKGQPLKDSSSPLKNNLKYGEKSPFQMFKLEDSRNSKHDKRWLGRQRVDTDGSQQCKDHRRTTKDIYWSRYHPNRDYSGNKTLALNTFSTVQTTDIKKSNLHNSYLGDSKFCELKKPTIKLDQSMKQFSLPNKQECSIHQKVQYSQVGCFNDDDLQPRITFSKEAIGVGISKISSEVDCINKTAQHERLVMIEKYFERLISFCGLEKDKSKRDLIRKQMCEIAVEIHRLRKQLNIV